jgi:hypothetical protein
MRTARELSNRIADLLRREHEALAEFLIAVATFDERRLWAELGHASFFSYLHRELGLSAGAAHYRKIAAGLVVRFPSVLEALRDGSLCLTSIVELAKVLTAENQAEVLPRFFHRSKREAQEISAELCPRPAPVRIVTTAVPSRSGPRLTAPSPQFPAPGPAAIGTDPIHPDEMSSNPVREVGPAAAPSTCSAARDVAEPLSADLRRLHITVSRRFLEKLAAAKDALSHSAPNATPEHVLEAALDLLLAQHAKRNGLVEKPRSAPHRTATGAVPAHVRRAAFQRAGGKCEWRFDSGERCSSTTRLQYDHVVPRAHGGPSTVGNIRVLCAGHNRLAARRVFGDEVMDRYRRDPSRLETSAVEFHRR